MSVTLATLVSEIGRSVQEAQNNLERYAMEDFFRYFETVVPDKTRCSSASEEDVSDGAGDPLAVPQTRRIGIPAPDGSIRTIDVPLSALLAHQTMGLDTVTVRLNITADLTKGSDLLLVNAEPDSVGKEGNGKSNCSQIELTFRAAPPAEGISRLDTHIQKHI